MRFFLCVRSLCPLHCFRFSNIPSILLTYFFYHDALLRGHDMPASLFTPSHFRGGTRPSYLARIWLSLSYLSMRLVPQPTDDREYTRPTFIYTYTIHLFSSALSLGSDPAFTRSEYTTYHQCTTSMTRKKNKIMVVVSEKFAPLSLIHTLIWLIWIDTFLFFPPICDGRIQYFYIVEQKWSL